MEPATHNGLFYDSGLRFSCTRCSCCCRFDSGYVWLSERDLERLCAGLGETRDQVIHNYCRAVDMAGFKQLSLDEQENYDCVFWRDGCCSVYDHRPLQCQAFPFWGPYMYSREDWDRLERSCPGVNIGRLHSREEIDAILAERRWEPPINADNL